MSEEKHVESVYEILAFAEAVGMSASEVYDLMIAKRYPEAYAEEIMNEYKRFYLNE